MADKNENIDKDKLDELKKRRDEENGPVDKKKLDELKKERDEQTGIPYENEHSSSDPNRSPSGDDRDANKSHHHEDYVEPYTKKKFHNDKKDKK